MTSERHRRGLNVHVTSLLFARSTDTGPSSGFVSVGPCTVRVMEQNTVAGEPVDLLQAAFRRIKSRKSTDGLVRFSARLERELGEPLHRALLRIEKELLDHDLSHGGPDVRTTPQRQADALVALAERLAAALRQP